ncbi:MAG: sigma-70 family RNA polymerase sigma factor [Candidatus Zixiibacteriota bacterium]
MAKTDSELWAEILLGSHAAWGELVERYKSLVYGVSSYIGLSMADSADCFQQTWVLLYQNRAQIHDSTRISSWLVTTAKREALRLKQRSGAILSERRLPEDRDTNPLPDEELEQLEAQVHLETALEELDLPCRKLLHLFFFANEEQTYEQIARDLGFAPNTLGAKRRRCLEKLKRILIAQGYFEERNND